MSEVKRVTTSDINTALRKQYAAPRYACLLEVRSSLGATNTVRSADAIIMGLWPSMGLEIEGFEVKVSRGDWQRERAQPQKAEAIAKFCDRWWILTAPNVIHDESEVPPGWGWMVFDGKRFKTMRKAPKLKPQPITPLFLASLLRKRDVEDTNVLDRAVEVKVASIREAAQTEVDRRVKERLREHESLEYSVRKFEEAAGFKITDENYRQQIIGRHDAKELGGAVAAVMSIGIGNIYTGVPQVLSALRQAADRIEKAISSVAPTDTDKQAAA